MFETTIIIVVVMEGETDEKVELSKNEISYLADIRNEKLSYYKDDLYCDEDDKTFYFMPDGCVSYDSYELNDFPVANNILKKLYAL